MGGGAPCLPNSPSRRDTDGGCLPTGVQGAPPVEQAAGGDIRGQRWGNGSPRLRQAHVHRSCGHCGRCPGVSGAYASGLKTAPIKVGSWHRLGPGAGLFLGKSDAFRAPGVIRSPGITDSRRKRTKLKSPRCCPFQAAGFLQVLNLPPRVSPVGGQTRAEVSQCVLRGLLGQRQGGTSTAGFISRPWRLPAAGLDGVGGVQDTGLGYR